MRIIFLIDSLEGYGAEKSIVQIALNLEEVTPVFIHLYNGDKLKTSLVKRGIKVYSLNIDVKYGFEKAVKLIEPIVRKEKPSLIHSTLFRADMVGRKLKSIFPEIVLVGSFVSNSYGKNRYIKLSYISQIKLFTTQVRDMLTANKVDYFICNSNAIKKTNTRALGISKNRVVVIYRGREFANFNIPDEEVSKLRRELNIKSQKIYFNVSRLHKGKGQEDLIQAFKKLNLKFPDSSLLIAGEGPFREELVNLIKKHDLIDKVLLLGYREDVPALLALADYFVFPSYFEGLPGALIEAIISKTPCIVSNIPENMECFKNGGALYFQAGDVEQLFQSMLKALSINNWNEITKESFENAKINFEIKKVSKEYEKFYFKIVSSSQGF